MKRITTALAILKSSAGSTLMGRGTVSNSKIKLTLSTTNKKPGTYKVKAAGTGKYTGTLSKTYKIVIKPTSVKSLTGGKKCFTVECVKLGSAYASGYQVRYSLKYSMEDAKTVTIGTRYTAVSKKITRLKANKKYYVQVRTFKTVSGKKYYSAWSKAKTVKTGK